MTMSSSSHRIFPASSGGHLSHYVAILTPILRIALALGAAWTVSGIRKRRALAAALAALAGGFCTDALLGPMFLHAGGDGGSGGMGGSGGDGLGAAALALLTVVAAFVSGALGSLLPRPAAGATLGAGAALFLAASLPGGTAEFAVAGPALALLGGALSIR